MVEVGGMTGENVLYLLEERGVRFLEGNHPDLAAAVTEMLRTGLLCGTICQRKEVKIKSLGEMAKKVIVTDPSAAHERVGHRVGKDQQ
jgi:hypothetical protein